MDPKVFSGRVNDLKAHAKALNAHLKGKQWIVGKTPTVADIVCGVTLTEAFQLCLDAGFRKGMSDLGAWFDRFVALPEVVANAGHIRACAKAMKQAPANPVKFVGKTEEKKPAANDDDLDLFGDDNEEDAEAAKRVAEAAAAKKKTKKPVIA